MFYDLKFGASHAVLSTCRVEASIQFYPCYYYNFYYMFIIVIIFCQRKEIHPKFLSHKKSSEVYLIVVSTLIWEWDYDTARVTGKTKKE